MNKKIFYLALFFLSIKTLLAQCPRQQVINDYNNLYLTASFNDTELSWTGNVSTCTPGVMSATVLNKHLQKINYYRKLVGGLTTNIVLDPTKNAKCMEAALMLEAANALTHCTGANGAPCNTFPCSTANAIQAAQSSNIASWFPNWNGADPIDNYMIDYGSGNEAVGHRRWILYSRANEMGIGTTTKRNAMWVIGNPAPTPTYDQFIAYPPNGYIPQGLVYPRWSFGVPRVDFFTPTANFSNATVTMTDNSGNNVPLSIVSAVSPNYGDPTMVWEPLGVITNSNMDLTYTVTISNIANAPQSSYTYQVKIVPPIFPPNCPTGENWNASLCSCSPPITNTTCITNRTISDNIASGIYKAASTIQTSGTVTVSGSADFQAGTSITLNAGFHAQSSSNFIAQILPCNTLIATPVIPVSTITSSNNRNILPSIHLNEPPLARQAVSIKSSAIQLKVSPNPFQHRTIINYHLPKTQKITLELLDLTGQYIQTIVPTQLQDVGRHQVQLDASDFKSGMYLLYLSTPDKQLSKKVVVIN